MGPTDQAIAVGHQTTYHSHVAVEHTLALASSHIPDPDRLVAGTSGDSFIKKLLSVLEFDETPDAIGVTFHLLEGLARLDVPDLDTLVL